MKKRKICIYCETWESGGIESFLFSILKHLDMQRFSVDIVAASLKDSVFTQELKQIGVQFRELSGSTRHMRHNLEMLRKIMEEQQYDVLHLNIYQALSMCYAREAKKANVPVRIIHSHNTALRKSKTRALKRMIHAVAKQCFSRNGTQFLACSSNAARFLFPKRIIDNRLFFVVPNGIETDRFRFDQKKRDCFREQWGLQDQFVIGNIGRLCYQKNQSFLLDVFSQLHSIQTKSKLLLVGAGNDEQMLRNKARSLNIEQDVLFYGTTSVPEEALWAMDAFVFPSRFEGLGIVAIEAQAAGLPVFCSEAIPKEAFVTKQMYSIPLREGAVNWAKRISAFRIVQDRAAMATQVRQSGFDIQDVAEGIEKRYLEC